MTRLVCMADTHMFHGDFAAKGGVPDGDILVHAGDGGRGGDVEELTVVRDFLASLPHKHKVVVAGNHDRLFQKEPARARELFRDFIYLEDTGAVVAGLAFYGSPWTPMFHSWAFMKDRGRPMAERWALIPPGLDVLVTHGPPRGILDDASRYRGGAAAGGTADHAGCDDLLARVLEVKPRVHLFGHIHMNQGVVERNGTRFVNCTTDESELLPIVVDL